MMSLLDRIYIDRCYVCNSSIWSDEEYFAEIVTVQSCHTELWVCCRCLEVDPEPKEQFPLPEWLEEEEPEW